MERARAGRTAGLARAVLERARGRRPAAGPEEDSERLSAAFASIVNLMNQATRECERTEASVAPSRAWTCQQHTRKPSEDIYIEVSPGTYSVTATSEDMVQQTHVVDVIAGQSVDLTFVL
ncbi:A-kinase-interacting protein 1 isoform X2 [Phaenicophaeus curvirostris]|uniref:A-kinase-interacting protein 1 isoform X2 n=1 Tax=Phaenicophaeus curvirostris TaxID=33595 RepID=UPI0037F0D930